MTSFAPDFSAPTAAYAKQVGLAPAQTLPKSIQQAVRKLAPERPVPKIIKADKAKMFNNRDNASYTPYEFDANSGRSVDPRIYVTEATANSTPV
jgi:hypothetical protein